MNRRPGPLAQPFEARAHKPGHRSEVNPYRDTIVDFGRELIPTERARERNGRWSEEFGRNAPITLELGVGNGSWLAEAARLHPNQDFIGLEIRYKRCVQAAEKLRDHASANGRVVRWSWFELTSLFAPGELGGLVIHHPDPWSSPSKAKHRLIRPEFLSEAAILVAAGGELRLKTDFLPHRDALLAGLPGTPWRLVGTSDDVLGSGAPWPDDIVTGYQNKFNRAGLPVYAAWLHR